MTNRYESLVQNLSILRQLDELDNPLEDKNELCRRMVETIAFGLAAENCSLMLLDERGEFLELRAACGPAQQDGRKYASGEWTGLKFRIGEGIVGAVAQTGAPIRVDDVSVNGNFLSIEKNSVKIGSLMCFPLRVEGRLVGVLNVSHSDSGFFDAESEGTLRLVAERAARTLSNRRIHEELRKSEEQAQV